jgi:hypothetical protein
MKRLIFCCVALGIGFVSSAQKSGLYARAGMNIATAKRKKHARHQ